MDVEGSDGGDVTGARGGRHPGTPFRLEDLTWDVTLDVS